MIRQTFNYHTHTKRCGHAIGEDEEYIQAAIDSGFKTLGFSEHLAYEGWDDEHERIPFGKMDDYFEDMKRLKEKYKDKIDIKIGVEFEYFPDRRTYLEEIKQKCDYMIIGQHAIYRDNTYLHDTCSDNDVLLMAEYLCEGISLGLADYVAHPDYFMFGRNDFSKECEKAIKMIGDCAKKHDVPVEINLKGMSRGKREFKEGLRYNYPFDEVWEILSGCGCKVVLGYDVHNPKFFSQRKWEDKAREYAKRFSITPISTLKL